MYLCLLVVTGCTCTSQQQNDISDIDLAFIRGSFNSGSGMDEMATHVRNQGYSVKVYSPYETIVGSPRAIIGYSLGSDVAIETAIKKRDQGTPVDLLILIDPWMTKTFPARIGKIYVIIGRGDESEYVSESPLKVIRQRGKIPILDFFIGHLNHLSIDRNPWVQTQVYRILGTEFQIRP